MDPLPANRDNSLEINNSDTINGNDDSGSRVPPEDREDQLLAFFTEHEIAVPPRVLFRALKVQHNITFSHSTVENILYRLRDDSEVMRVDKNALDNGKIVELPEDATDRRTYYFITEKGRERLAERRDQ